MRVTNQSKSIFILLTKHRKKIMKTKFGVILFLISFIALSTVASAVDYELKTTLTRTETRTLTPVNPALCDGTTPAPLPPRTYNVSLIDSTITHFSIRIVKKVGGAVHHTVATTAIGSYLDLATGEFTYNVTGIPKTKDILLIRLYNQTGGVDTILKEMEMSASSGSVRTQVGYVNFGNVGDGSGSGEAGAIAGTGGAISTASISNTPSTSEITVNFDDLGDTDYITLVTLQRLSGSLSNNSDVSVPVVHSKTSNSFKVYIKELTDTTQDLRLDILIQGYQ